MPAALNRVRSAGSRLHASADCDRSVAVVLRLVRAFDRHAEVVGLFVGQLGQLHADLLQVQARDFLVELLRQDVDLRSRSCPCSPTGRSAPASGWRTSCDITKLGWPVAQPRFTRRPSASRKIALPSANVYLSTCGLMLMLLHARERRSARRPGSRCRSGRCCRRSPGPSSALMCSSVMTSLLPVVVT